MREIEFRGKYYGKWVYGYLTIENPNQLAIKTDYNEKFNHKESNIYYVDKKSVGQYIGIKDRKGKKIFEGDILRVVNNLNEATKKHNTHNVVVEYKVGGFVARQSSSVLYSHFDDYNTPIVTFEVIGNIYDNPELIA